MKIKESAENYLETILVLSKKNGYVRSVDIATELDYSKPSVSVAMKNLREHGYITTDKEGFIVLTDTGLEIALKMYERHVLITRWLVSLGVEQEIAAEDACKIEHVLSKQTFDAIKRYVDSHN